MSVRALGTLNVAVDLAVFLLTAVFLRRDKSRLSRGRLVTLFVVIGLGAVLGYQFFANRFSVDFRMMSLYSMLAVFSLTPLGVFLYPTSIRKSMFFVFLSLPSISLGRGLGQLIAAHLGLSGRVGWGCYLLIYIGISAILLCTLRWIVRKKYPSLYESNDAQLWGYLLLLIIIIGLMQLLTGNVFSQTNFTLAIAAPTRLASGLVMIVVLYIAGNIHREALTLAAFDAENTARKREADEHDRRYGKIVANVEEMRRLRHDARQIFSTINVLCADENSQELVSFCAETYSYICEEKKEVEKVDTPVS